MNARKNLLTSINGLPNRLMVGLVFVVTLIAVVPAQATFMNLMDTIVYENADQADTSRLHLWINVINGEDYVDFTFMNRSAIPSVVTAIYIESTDFSSAHLKNGTIVSPQPSGVDFAYGVSPSKPAGSIKNFGGNWAGNLLGIGADVPPPANGIGPGEDLTVRFDLDGISFDQLLTALSDPMQFRIAQHVQGLPGDSSIWTVNTSQHQQEVPLPPTAILMGMGFFGLTQKRLYRRLIG